ncbi:DUF418 domain-containing protein [Temperatibacter marinus]|uniref:DUF418 domain-containing protein n=1 Tax=Temperatibacter marinus TaxID=1456591 RepID=A0AA52H8D7_9PROT|nr:DUF418 domain-containing protein [Temperatibacter marinus]WND01734.1 DUF418 domain-containing protein [Temperatibacter marinus]
MTSSAVPIMGQERINSLDILRGVALFGILIMNINGMALPGSGYGNPNAWGGASGWDLTTWFTVNIFFESTMRTIFSMLFGAGAILFMDRLSEKLPGNEASEIYMRRNSLLILFGAIHAYLLLWFGDILFYYGIAALILFSFRKANFKFLIAVCLLIMSIQITKGVLKYNKLIDDYEKSIAAETKKEAGETLTKKEEGAIKKWTGIWERRNTQPEKAKEEIEKRHKGWWDNVLAFKGRVMTMESYVMYDFFFFDAFLAMLVGMMVYRLGIFTLEKSTGFYGGMMIVGYLIGLPIRYYITMEIYNSGFNPIAFKVMDIFLDVSRLALAMGHIGLLLLFVRYNILGFLLKALGAVGRMALSNYIMHSVIFVFLFTGVGLSMFGELMRHELIYVWAIICVSQLILSPLWLSYYKYGPLEWVWRSLTYGERQAFKK